MAARDTQPIDIPARARSSSAGASSQTFGKSESPYFNVSPSSTTMNIELYNALKTARVPGHIYNITNFFQRLSSNQYVLHVKNDRFHEFKQKIFGEYYTHKLDFHYNRNMLSLYTDFILSGIKNDTRIMVVMNGNVVYNHHTSGEDIHSFFLTRPNVLPLITAPVLSFTLTIYLNTTAEKPKLIYSEIKTKPNINLVLNLLERWYLTDGKETLFITPPGHEDTTLVPDTWQYLLTIPIIDSLKLADL